MPGRMTRRLTAHVVVVAAAAALAGGVRAQTDPFPDLVARLEAAAVNGKVDAIRVERVNAMRMLAGAAGPRADLLRYTVAYGAWRLAFAASVSPADQAAMLEDAEAQLQRVLTASPDDVESLALMSAVEGARIAQNPDLGMTLGMKSSMQIDRALRLAPLNPRVLVMSGLALYNTPPEYGGSIADAEKKLAAALAAFAKEPASKPWPNWGRFDAHVWLGQARAHRGDKAGARIEYEAALAIAPQSDWVRYALLPLVK
jgi:hypothetical protein